MSNNQSSIEWLIEELEGDDSKIARVIGLKKYNSIIKQAKKMHKQEIMDAYTEEVYELYPEDYYNEVFGHSEIPTNHSIDGK